MRAAEGERETERRIWMRNHNEKSTKGGKSEINIGTQNVEFGKKESESEFGFGRNSVNYGAEEIDLLKEEVDDKEEDPEDDPDVQDIRWF